MSTFGETIIILDFGAQYSQLIARRVRECHVYCEILSFDTPCEEIAKKKPNGIIFSGGPNSVYADGSPMCDKKIFELGVPIFGICYGMQAMAFALGGTVEKGKTSEYGRTPISLKKDSKLFNGIDKNINVWMSHGDHVDLIPKGFNISVSTETINVGAMENEERRFYGVQFHPEVEHTDMGIEIIRNFVINICKCAGSWTSESYIDMAIAEIKETVKNNHVICGLSGGVDSSVTATLIHKAIGNQLTCIFVDHGLMRLNEPEDVKSIFVDSKGMNIIFIDARKRFLDALAGISDPEQKRKIIGAEFIKVFDEESNKIKNAKFLAQGTIYPDIVESGNKHSATIKSHHNVGGLPDYMKLGLVEPLKYLFKDEVREVGKELGLPHDMVWRHPFPGPGLGVRCIGKITEERLDTLRLADAIYIEEIRKAGLYNKIWQAFAILLPVKSVGVKGDFRTYEETCVLRAVNSTDAMTADWAIIPSEVLTKISSRILNEIKGINRVLYDVSTKPPSTIEWE